MVRYRRWYFRGCFDDIDDDVDASIIHGNGGGSVDGIVDVIGVGIKVYYS